MRWNLEIFKKVLPRHFELILMIDHFFIRHLRTQDNIKNNENVIQRMRIIATDNNNEQIIRIPHFAFISSGNLFNMSYQQLETSKSVIYRELDDIFPTKLQYVCQGINTRQWIQCTNSHLANLISETLGDDDEWLHDAQSLLQLRPWKSDEHFVAKFQKVKLDNKSALME